MHKGDIDDDDDNNNFGGLFFTFNFLVIGSVLRYFIFFSVLSHMFCSCIKDDFLLGRKAVGSPPKHFAEFTIILYRRHHNCLN